MPARTNEMGERYNALRAQKIPGKEAVKTVNKEFGTDISYGAMRSYGFSAKKKSGDVEPRSQRKEQKKNQRLHGSKRSAGPSVKSDPDPTRSTEIDERIRSVAREVFQEMLHNMRNERNIITDTEDVPPEPKVITGGGRGRRENRKYEKVSVTVDKVLWDLFTKERDRLKVSAGRLMDIILWRHYGKPKLSFEEPAREAQ